MIAVIKIYRRWLSPLLGPRCRFYPTCSAYALTCFEKYSFRQALFMASKRCLRCHPWNPGGVDLP